jgi:hypothetical protein
MAILNGLREYRTTSSTQRNIDGADMVLPNPVLPLGLSYLANSSQNYAIYRQEFDAFPGIPFLLPHIVHAKQERLPVPLELFQKVAIHKGVSLSFFYSTMFLYHARLTNTCPSTRIRLAQKIPTCGTRTRTGIKQENYTCLCPQTLSGSAAVLKRILTRKPKILHGKSHPNVI